MDIEKAVAALLRDKERIEYQNAEIFLVDKGTMEKIIGLRAMADEEVAERKRPPRDSLSRYVKPVNPDNPAFKYGLYLRKTPRIISDPLKVRAALDQQLSIWKNMERKALREFIEREQISGEELTRLEKELEEKIHEADREFDRLKRDYDRYEVFITNYETAKIYPTIYYSTKEEVVCNAIGTRVLEPMKKAKKINAHLSIVVPNVVWYTPENTRRGRSNASVIEKVLSGEYSVVAGSIYYKRDV